MSVGDPEIDAIIAKMIPVLRIVTDGKIPKGFTAIRFEAIDVQTKIEEFDLTEADFESGELYCQCGRQAVSLIGNGHRFSCVVCPSTECREKAMKLIHVRAENHETEKYQRLLERAIKWQTK